MTQAQREFLERLSVFSFFEERRQEVYPSPTRGAQTQDGRDTQERAAAVRV